jgi:hypothetical protein
MSFTMPFISSIACQQILFLCESEAITRSVCEVLLQDGIRAEYMGAHATVLTDALASIRLVRSQQPRPTQVWLIALPEAIA